MSPNFARALVGTVLLCAGIYVWRVNDRARQKAAALAPPAETCTNHLKLIASAFRIWALNHDDQFPFNVSTNKGGTHEYCLIGVDGFDENAAVHFQALAGKEMLPSPALLICPQDTSREAASDFGHLRSRQITYELHTGTNVKPENGG
jgi:hypothetical protein